MGLTVDLDLRPEVAAAHPDDDIYGVISNIQLLDAMAKGMGVTSLGEMGIADDEEDGSAEGDDDDIPLFPPSRGIRTISLLLECLRWKPRGAEDREDLEAVLGGIDGEVEVLTAELDELLRCLDAARKKKARFRFVVV